MSVSISSVLVAALLVGIPGLGVGLAVHPPRAAPMILRLALVAPFGYALVGGAAFVLALLHAMTGPAFLGLTVILTGVAWAVALRRGSPGEHVRAAREEVAAARLAFLVGAVVLTAFAAIRFTFAPVLNLADQTPLRYWADGLEIADAHRIPALSAQWGRLFPSTVSKVLLNCFHAGASLVLGRGPLGPMGALSVVVAVGLVAAAVAFGREIGLRRTAPLFALALFADHLPGSLALTEDLSRYKAENWGRLLLLAGAALAMRAFRARAWDRQAAGRDAMLAGALLGLGAGTHLVPLAVGAGLLAGYVVALLVVERRVGEALRVALLVAAVAALVGAAVLLLPRGDIGFQGTGDTRAYAQLAADLGQPPGWDPTLFLAHGTLVQPPHHDASGFYEPVGTTYHEYVQAAVGEQPLRRPFLPLLPLVLIGGMVLLLVFGTTEHKVLGLAAVLMTGAILAVAYAFSYRYEVFAIAEFGTRRLFDYGAVPAALIGFGVVELVLSRAGDRLHRRLGPNALPATAVALMVLGAGILLPTDRPAAQAPFLATALGPLAWIERNVPCDGRVLADRRTLGTFESFTRHAGVLEGMGPYLRPAVLSAAIRDILAARAFFLDPAAGEPYLRREGVAVVVATMPGQGLGGANRVAAVSRSTLDGVPFLVRVARSASVTVYRFTGFDPGAASRFPSVAERPGYRCG